MEQPIIDTSLHDVRISVSEELSEHYNKIIRIRDQILDEEGSEDKSIVSILNATTTIIKELARIQESLYNSEKFAVLQQIIVETLKKTDKPTRNRVITALKEQLERL